MGSPPPTLSPRCCCSDTVILATTSSISAPAGPFATSGVALMRKGRHPQRKAFVERHRLWFRSLQQRIMVQHFAQLAERDVLDLSNALLAQPNGVADLL